jgi:hypothetical protein
MEFVGAKFVEGFGKALGERSAAALGSLLHRLWNTKGLARRKQLEEIVEPAFALFLEIYAEYERSFRQYRAELTDIDDVDQIHRLIERIEGDLRFTAKDRVDLLSHLEHAANGVFEDFVRSMIEFLVTNEPSLSGSAEDALRPLEIATQVHRRGLIADLRAVTEPWTIALDPGYSAPPLYDDELERAVTELAARYGIAGSDPVRDTKLRARLAVERLDARLEAMVAAYRKVRVEYDALRLALTR